MMQYYCHKCGTGITNLFYFRGNIYGSECIQNLPVEEYASLRADIDIPSIIQGVFYTKRKGIDIDKLISAIPSIGSTITDDRSDLEESRKPFKIVLGYSKHKRKLKHAPRRGKEEFAIRVKSVFPGCPQFNREEYLYTEFLLKRMTP